MCRDKGGHPCSVIKHCFIYKIMYIFKLINTLEICGKEVVIYCCRYNNKVLSFAFCCSHLRSDLDVGIFTVTASLYPFSISIVILLNLQKLYGPFFYDVAQNCDFSSFSLLTTKIRPSMNRLIVPNLVNLRSFRKIHCKLSEIRDPNLQRNVP